MTFVNPVLDAAANVTNVAVFALEITERKRAEADLRQAHATLELRVQERTAELEAANAALRRSEARLRLALDASRAATMSLDVASHTPMWDDRFQELYGFEPDAPRSYDAWLTRVHPKDREALLARIQKLMEPAGGEFWNDEFRVLHPTKGERWIASLGSVERDQAGRAVRFIGINFDITERKRAEEVRRAQLEYIETIYQTAPLACACWTRSSVTSGSTSGWRP